MSRLEVYSREKTGSEGKERQGDGILISKWVFGEKGNGSEERGKIRVTLK